MKINKKFFDSAVVTIMLIIGFFILSYTICCGYFCIKSVECSGTLGKVWAVYSILWLVYGLYVKVKE